MGRRNNGASEPCGCNFEINDSYVRGASFPRGVGVRHPCHPLAAGMRGSGYVPRYILLDPTEGTTQKSWYTGLRGFFFQQKPQTERLPVIGQYLRK